jgi:hypothetical protein
MQKIKQILSFLFSKETLIKIILIQIIIILLAYMNGGGFNVYHKGGVRLSDGYGGFDININR